MFGIKVEEKKVPVSAKVLIPILVIIQFPKMYLAKRRAAIKRKEMADKIRQNATLRRVDLETKINELEGKVLALTTDEVLQNVSHQGEIDLLIEQLTDLQVEVNQLP